MSGPGPGAGAGPPPSSQPRPSVRPPEHNRHRGRLPGATVGAELRAQGAAAPKSAASTERVQVPPGEQPGRWAPRGPLAGLRHRGQQGLAGLSPRGRTARAQLPEGRSRRCVTDGGARACAAAPAAGAEVALGARAGSTRASTSKTWEHQAECVFRTFSKNLQSNTSGDQLLGYF